MISTSLAELLEQVPQDTTVFLNSSESVDFTCATPVAIDVSLVLHDSTGNHIQEESAGDITFYQRMESGSNGRKLSVQK